jgi:hypothetical protein
VGVGGVGLGGDGASGISWLSYRVDRSRNILLLLLANINIERFSSLSHKAAWQAAALGMTNYCSHLL